MAVLYLLDISTLADGDFLSQAPGWFKSNGVAANVSAGQIVSPGSFLFVNRGEGTDSGVWIDRFRHVSAEGANTIFYCATNGGGLGGFQTWITNAGNLITYGSGIGTHPMSKAPTAGEEWEQRADIAETAIRLRAKPLADSDWAVDVTVSITKGGTAHGIFPYGGTYGTTWVQYGEPTGPEDPGPQVAGISPGLSIRTALAPLTEGAAPSTGSVNPGLSIGITLAPVTDGPGPSIGRINPGLSIGSTLAPLVDGPAPSVGSINPGLSLGTTLAPVSADVGQHEGSLRSGLSIGTTLGPFVAFEPQGTAPIALYGRGAGGAVEIETALAPRVVVPTVPTPVELRARIFKRDSRFYRKA